MALSNSQYDKIKKIYTDRQLSRQHEIMKRLAYVNEHIEGFREINDSISSLCIKQAELLLDGQSSALTNLKESLQTLIDQKNSLLKKAGLPLDYLQVPYICNTCQDTGYINGQKCTCFKQVSLSLLYEQSNLKEYIESTNFSKLSDEYYSGEDLKHFRDSYQKSINFINTFKNDYQNLCFYGTVGTGKSFLSACIANELMKEGYSVIYFSAPDLFDALSQQHAESKNKNNIATQHYQDIFTCDLLIIDDLGTEYHSEYSLSRLFTCLNERYLKRKSIIISTNFSLEELQARYTDRIFSRISTNFLFCRMTGPDIRML